MKKYIYITLLGILLGISICYFLIYSEQQESATYYLKDAVLSAILGIALTTIISNSVSLLNRFLPYHNHTGNRLFAGFFVHFIVSFFLIISTFYLYRLFFYDVIAFFENYSAVVLKLGIILFILTVIFEVIYFALYSYYSYSKFQIETIKQERKQFELQLKALKSQLSPHFLFNSLNSISSLIYKDENKAETFIRKLAKMYDYTLKSYHQKLIPLQEEIDFVNAYVYLLQTRFQNKITCKISIDEDLLTTKIPPLTLQMLVENAVKHNQLSTDRNLHITIKSIDNEISIQNNLTKTPKNITSFNIGLSNINARYLLLVNKAISVISNDSFTVKIPVIR